MTHLLISVVTLIQLALPGGQNNFPENSGGKLLSAFAFAEEGKMASNARASDREIDICVTR